MHRDSKLPRSAAAKPLRFAALRAFVPLCLRCMLPAAILAFAVPAIADSTVLQFAPSFDLAKPTIVGDATIALSPEGNHTNLRIHTGRWGVSGVQFPAPNGAWDLSKNTWIYADVKNVCDHEVHIRCRIDNAGKDHGFIKNLLPAGIFVNGDIMLEPGQSGTIKIELRRHKPDWIPFELPGMDCKPWGQADSSDPNSPGAIDPAKIVDICIYVRKPVTDMTFELTDIRAAGTYVSPPEILRDPAKFFPFVDQYGQYIHQDWPGKVHSAADLAAQKEAEAKDLAAHPGPENWDQYGGWKDGPQLKATGSVYVTKYNGKWFFVDPEGKLFFSNGIDCVTAGEGSTLITGREKYFKDLPARDSEFKQFFSAGRRRRGSPAPAANAAPAAPKFNFDFERANLLRKYGAGWEPAFTDITHQRLRSWGINTMGNWSSPAIYEPQALNGGSNLPHKRTPYTVNVGARGKPLQGAVGWWGKFTDVFDPDFAAGIQRSMAAQADTSAKDPYCLGYFVGNEQDFGGDDFQMADWVLACPPDQAAKKVFIDDLKAKYGDIGKLNAVWGTQHASWDDLLKSTTPPDTQKAFADLSTFAAKFFDTYFKTIHDAIKEYAPNRLYLGCRFGGGYEAPPITAACAKYCDVVSCNLYRDSLDGFHLTTNDDKPILIGEFSFWATDRGYFNQGGMYTEASATEADRAERYKRFVESALRHPQIVGCHWFKYVDEPTTGRGDGENFQFGFTSIADTPYAETVNAARELGAELYEYRMAGR